MKIRHLKLNQAEYKDLGVKKEGHHYCEIDKKHPQFQKLHPIRAIALFIFSFFIVPLVAACFSQEVRNLYNRAFFGKEVVILYKSVCSPVEFRAESKPLPEMSREFLPQQENGTKVLVTGVPMVPFQESCESDGAASSENIPTPEIQDPLRSAELEIISPSPSSVSAEEPSLLETAIVIQTVASQVLIPSTPDLEQALSASMPEDLSFDHIEDPRSIDFSAWFSLG